jgi:hypothetical protein
MAKKKSDSVTWTGKNLAEVRKFHKAVAHHPRAEGDESYRDASQHPENLHLETAEGTTLVIAPGDTIMKDAKGRLLVRPNGTRPGATGRIGGPTVAAEAYDGLKGKGGAR